MYGMQVRDPSTGSIIFDTTDRMLRIVDSFVVETASGSRTYAGLGANGFFMTQWMTSAAASHGQHSTDQPPFTAQSIWQEGDTIKWSYNYSRRYNMWFDSSTRTRINVTVVMYK